jgi:hypothetical protein
METILLRAKCKPSKSAGPKTTGYQIRGRHSGGDYALIGTTLREAISNTRTYRFLIASIQPCEEMARRH